MSENQTSSYDEVRDRVLNSGNLSGQPCYDVNGVLDLLDEAAEDNWRNRAENAEKKILALLKEFGFGPPMLHCDGPEWDGIVQTLGEKHCEFAETCRLGQSVAVLRSRAKVAEEKEG